MTGISRATGRGDQVEHGRPEDALAPLWHIRAGALDPATAQTPGMARAAAISMRNCGAHGLWMGENRMAPASHSSDHHHGESQTGIYVLSGHPTFVFLNDGTEHRIEAAPGDYVYVPPWTPHREENNSPTDHAVVILARNTDEAIVVNLPSLMGR